MTDQEKGVSPGAAALMGALIGVAGGLADAVLYQNPHVRKEAKKRFNDAKENATKKIQELRTQGEQALNDVDDSIHDGMHAGENHQSSTIPEV